MNSVRAHKETRPGMVLKAVIIYDDFDAATHATGLLERVALHADETIKWDTKPWRCDVLKQPTLAALTVAVAANADLIVLAVSRIHPPPPELLAWLKNWAEHRRVKDAAVLALPADINHLHSKSWNEIKAFVEGHNLAFLGGNNVWTDKHSGSFVHRLQQRKQPVAPPSLPAFAERLAVPHHWGINE